MKDHVRLEFSESGYKELESCARRTADWFIKDMGNRRTLELTDNGAILTDFSAVKIKGQMVLVVLNKKKRENEITLTTYTPMFERGHAACDFYIEKLNEFLAPAGMRIKGT